MDYSRLEAIETARDIMNQDIVAITLHAQAHWYSLLYCPGASTTDGRYIRLTHHTPQGDRVLIAPKAIADLLRRASAHGLHRCGPTFWQECSQGTHIDGMVTDPETAYYRVGYLQEGLNRAFKQVADSGGDPETDRECQYLRQRIAIYERKAMTRAAPDVAPDELQDIPF